MTPFLFSITFCDTCNPHIRVQPISALSVNRRVTWLVCLSLLGLILPSHGVQHTLDINSHRQVAIIARPHLQFNYILLQMAHLDVVLHLKGDRQVPHRQQRYRDRMRSAFIHHSSNRSRHGRWWLLAIHLPHSPWTLPGVER